MSKYLSVDTLAAAVKRLGKSSAQPTLSDYLIFKRAKAIEVAAGTWDAGTGIVTGSTGSSYIQAVNDLAALDPSWIGTTTRPEGGGANVYFKPFGSDRVRDKGYVSAKFWSNGSPDTVSRWSGRNSRILTLVEGSSPKAFTFGSAPASELAPLMLQLKAANTAKPALLDLAIWLYRFSDLEELTGSGNPSEQFLCEMATKNLGLTQDEITTLLDGA